MRDYTSLLRSIFISSLVKPFVISTGNSGTGKTRQAESLAIWLRGKDSAGYELIAIGADWTDNRNIVGFVNYLRTSGEGDRCVPVYQSTKILNLLLRAQANPSLPFFLILDEMNLSHVERYFADFLSAMESHSGVLHLHNEVGVNGKLPATAGGAPVIPQSLKIPDNVFVIGTVNVDETTYMFSPKVLDRANVIEFRMAKESLENFLKSTDQEMKDVAQADETYARSFLDLARKARAGTLAAFGQPGDRDEVQAAIKDIFSIMEAARLEFGFRTIKELLRYFHVDFALSEKPQDWKWEPVFDVQILQKILPKLHGAKRRIEPLLIRLALFCETGKVPEEKEATPEHLSSSPVLRKPAVYPASYKKLCEMIDAVRRDQFVSFIQ